MQPVIDWLPRKGARSPSRQVAKCHPDREISERQKYHFATNINSLAKQAMSSFRQARSLKGDKKIDKMLDGLNYLSNSVLEVSDSITPISTMNATSALLADNIQKMINQSQLNIINTLGNKKRVKTK